MAVIYDIPLRELRLFTDYGRTSRPLFIVDNQRLLITKDDIRRLQVHGCCWCCLLAVAVVRCSERGDHWCIW